MRLSLFVLVALLPCLALAQTGPWSMQIEFLGLGVQELGPDIYGDHDSMYTHPGVMPAASALHVTLKYGRLRVGTSVVEVPGVPFTYSILPVHVGWTLYERAARYGLLHGMVPEVYAEAEAYWKNRNYDWNGTYVRPPAGKLALCLEIDRYCVGAGAEVGCLAWRTIAEPDAGLHFGPAASVYVRLVTNFGL
jgi:hypothetical protein